jgi:hypothetical protein
MKLLLDQGLPRSAASLLRERGIDAVHVAELGLSAASDAAILERGRETGCVVVTLVSVRKVLKTERSSILSGAARFSAVQSKDAVGG